MKKNELPKQKKGYNVYQTRLYSITDELVGKKNFVEQKEAETYILSNFNREHDGPLFSRGIIRSIDPVLKVWISPCGMDNPKALLYESEQITDQWKTTFYEMGDTIISSSIYNKAIPLELLAKQMALLNAFYVVVSCHEVGTPDDCFIISEIHRNEIFNLTIMGESYEKIIEGSKLRPDERLEDVYKHLLDEDTAETQRINAVAAKRSQKRGTGEEMG